MNATELPKVLMQKLPGGITREVAVGDTMVTPRGKTFFISGWDDIKGEVYGQTCCEQKYFIAATASAFGCYFANP